MRSRRRIEKWILHQFFGARYIDPLYNTFRINRANLYFFGQCCNNIWVWELQIMWGIWPCNSMFLMVFTSFTNTQKQCNFITTQRKLARRHWAYQRFHFTTSVKKVGNAACKKYKDLKKITLEILFHASIVIFSSQTLDIFLLENELKFITSIAIYNAWENVINSFHTTGLFYTPKNIRKPLIFCCFQGV